MHAPSPALRRSDCSRPAARAVSSAWNRPPKSPTLRRRRSWSSRSAPRTSPDRASTSTPGDVPSTQRALGGVARHAADPRSRRFAVPAGAAPTGNVDDGKSTISGTPQVQPGTAATPSTFGTGGGAFSYGFAPVNSVHHRRPAVPRKYPAAAVRDAPGNTNDIYPEPMYGAAATQLPFLLGPPATPEIHNGTFPPGSPLFVGFHRLRNDAVAGTYTLTVTVPGNLAGRARRSRSKTAAATLTTLGGYGRGRRPRSPSWPSAARRSPVAARRAA